MWCIRKAITCDSWNIICLWIVVTTTYWKVTCGKEGLVINGSGANGDDNVEDYKEINQNQEAPYQTNVTDVPEDTSIETLTVPNEIVTFPDDPSKLSCSVLGEYGQWTFMYKYSASEIKALLCRCQGICKHVTVPQSVRDEIHKDRYDPLAERNRPEFIAVVTVFGLLFVIGTVGNIITIVGLLKWMKHRTPTFAFIISLSCSDLLMLCVCMPIKVTEYFHLGNIFTDFTCRMSYYLRDFTLICSVLTLTVISFERYYAICRPLVVQYRCTWRRARKIIVVLWLLSSCLAIPTVFMTKYYNPAGLQFWECLPQSHNDIFLKLYFCYYMGILFVLPTILMCFTYGRSCHSLWRSTVVTRKLQGTKRETYVKTSHNVHGIHSKAVSKEKDDVTSRRRVIKVLIWIVVAFVLCWGPPLLVQLLSVVDVIRQNRNKIRLATEALTYISSTLNPYLFMAMSSETYVKTSHNAHGVHSKAVSKEKDDVTSRRRVIKVLIWIVVAFVLCWGPPLLVQLLSVVDVIRQNRNKIRLATEVLTYITSTLNPYLFMAMSSQFCPKSIHCLRFLRRRDALSFTSGKGSTISMNAATTSVLPVNDEHGTYI